MVKTILTVVGLVMLIYSAAEATPLDDSARDAAVQWLQLIDAGRYEEAASQGSQEVRSFVQWVAYFKSHRAVLGRLSKRQLAGITHTAIVSGVPEVRRYYIIRFKTAFEHRAGATEQITLTKIGCCWEVFEYKVEELSR